MLLKPAMLAMTPPGTTRRHAVGLDATADGSAVEPDDVTLDRDSLSMIVSHFSIHVVLESNGDGGFSAKYFTDEQYAATLQDQLVKFIQDERDRMVDDPNYESDPTVLAAKLDQYWDAIVQPIIDTSNGTPGSPGSCQFFRDNYDTVDAAGHQRAVLGTGDGDARLARATDGLGLGLQHCWTEAEHECMITGHWAFTLLVASRMSVLGVHTAEGTAPDPFSLYWCGTANGYIDVAIDSHLVDAPNGDTDNMTNHFRYWITAMPLVNPPSQGGAYRLSLVNMGTTLDLTSDERSDFYWNNGSCAKTSTTHLSFTGRSSTFSYGGEFTSGDVGLNTDTGVYGYGDLFPTQTSITNNCGTNSTVPAFVQADLGRLHTEHIDRAGKDLLFGGEHTEGGSGTGNLLHYVYSGSIHISDLASLLPG